jgi:D-beta-D-heptose 7-phosphate kinase / D-beta-D-heptose 1-phosphate adenosyltransferase
MGNEMLSTDLLHRLRDRAPRVVVVGDLLLDGWWVGRTNRVAREAPAPVVEIESRTHAPGGAGNTAANLAALGAQVRLVGAVGDDDAGATLLDLLRAAGVEVSGVSSTPAIATVTKNRVVVAEQILLRLDEPCRPVLPDDVHAEVTASLIGALRDADAIVVCDYGRGAHVADVATGLEAAGRPDLVVVDAHDPTAWAALRPDLATPNAAEAFAVLGVPAPPRDERVQFIVDSAAALLERTGATATVVTVDFDGTVVVGGRGLVHRTRTFPASESRASGAGDTYVAALTAARAAGAALPDAADLAQLAADVVVADFGTSVCTIDALEAQLTPGPVPVLPADELIRRIAADRAAGRRVVFTNGCFDVIHRGHTTYLQQAARLGDVLIVAVNSDDSVRRLKGSTRPINAAADRAGVLAALGCVDYVTVFETDTPIPLLEELRPDVYAKGGDYSPDMLEETPVVEAYGGEVRVLDYLSAQSTTELVARIRGGAPTMSYADGAEVDSR